MWQLTITRTDNGYYLEGITGEKICIEDSSTDELKDHEELLWNVMEFFNFQGSKHDKERLRVVREHND